MSETPGLTGRGHDDVRPETAHAPSDTLPFYACPFYKTDSAKHSSCYLSKGTRRFTDIRQHILRCHLRPGSTAGQDRGLSRWFNSPYYPRGSIDTNTWSGNAERVSGIRCPEVRGTLDGVPVRALPDWGSTVNAVSQSFARRHKLRIDTTQTSLLPLLGGNVAESIGRVVGLFKFKGEKEVYRREFQVLRKSVHDVILGREFLDETKTLTKHDRRIIHTVRPCIRRGKRLFLMDDAPKERIRCAVGGAAASAFPDTGSDLMLVSGDFARRNGFKIHRGKRYKTEIELIDGSTIRTDGMVLNVELQFDVPPPSSHELNYDQYHGFLSGLSSLTGRGTKTTTFMCDLHVVEDLPCDIILSNEFIFQNKVFSRFKSLFCPSSVGTWSRDVVNPEHRLMFVRNKSAKLSWFSRRRRRAHSQTNSSESFFFLIQRQRCVLI